MGGVSRLTGKSVIVTGTGCGIGRAAAPRFAEAGANLLIADGDEQASHAVTGQIGAAGGVAVPVIGDLSGQRVIEQVVEVAAHCFGGGVVLVHVAATTDRMSDPAETTDAEWDRVLQADLTAPLQLTRAVLPHVFKAGRGAIVFTAFEASQRDSAAFTVATHGIIGLARSLAVMYRERGVRTNAIVPGATRNSVQSDTDPAAHSPEVIDSYLHNAGHAAAAEEQAAAIVFLASDAAGNLNGAILPVDGGWCAA